MTEADTATRRTQSDPLSLLLLLGGRWAWGSLEMSAAEMADGAVWDRMRLSALRAGRALPERPPTPDQLEAWRRRVVRGGPDALGETAELLADRFTDVAVPLVQQAGLLVPAPPRWHHLGRGHVLYGDGSAFRPLSDLRAEEDGSVPRSRARSTAGDGPGNRGARVATTYPDKDRDLSLPVTTIGVHGGGWNQRGMVAIRLFRDGREVAWSLNAISKAVELSCGGVHGVVSDKAMAGQDMHALMRLGVVPVVEMKQAQKPWSHLALPLELQRRRYAKGGKTERRPGKGRVKERAKSTAKRAANWAATPR